MNERRRTLLFSGGYEIPTENGVYIESVEHEFYLRDDWDTANTANSIAVVTDECKFRIALTQISSEMQMSSSHTDPWETQLSGTTNSGITESAGNDYNGPVNTNLIVEKCQSSTDYAAGWCNAYTFPDGVTRGYLPALGELRNSSNYIGAVVAALSTCGGEPFVYTTWYWSSTFWGSYYGDRKCWMFHWNNGASGYDSLNQYHCVRAFGAL